MNLFVHDYAGHPFQIQLSRALARRGHTVRHVYCASIGNTPQATEPRDDDPPSLTIEPIALREMLDKDAYVKRWRQEREYAGLLVESARRARPDVILSANTPLDAQGRLLRWARGAGIPFVFWLQDLLGVATRRVLHKKLPGVGALIGGAYVRQERSQLQQSNAVVGITDDFKPLLAQWGVPAERIHTVENWAPLDALPVRAQDSAWSREHDLAGRFVFLYSGNLGLKHDPLHLVRLAERFANRPEVRIVVITQGWGRTFLEAEKQARGLPNLVLLDFQPYDALPDVLASASVLVALLEPDAGVYSVPSKVLTYLCAARPILLAVPPENLAARIVRREDAGLVTAPSDAAGFLTHAEHLFSDADARQRAGSAARTYAETHFALDAITDRFEAILGLAHSAQ